MKVILMLTACAAAVLAEPPVNNRYLPPSSSYGAPKHTNAIFRSRPSSTYGAPRSHSRRPSSYSPPALPATYLPPSNQYGAPASPANEGHLTTPGIEYGAPSVEPSVVSTAAENYPSSLSTPSSSYGAPARSRTYLPPGGHGYDDGSNGAPANYNFEYMVKDDASGNDFGHRESRQGDRTEGRYYVLLPDGRKQTVQYEADQNGYRPKITYEDTGAGDKFGGYSKNAQSGYQNSNGYHY